MMSQLKEFKANGTTSQIANWIKIRDEVREELLTLPPENKTKRKRRKTTNVQRRLLSQTNLLTLDE